MDSGIEVKLFFVAMDYLQQNVYNEKAISKEMAKAMLF